MKIDIQTHYFSLTDSLHHHSEQRLHSALSCFDDYIQSVAMHLSDINRLRANNPYRCEDKCCHILIVLTGLSDVVIADVEADLYIAIERATDRAGQAVLRKIERQRTLLKQGR